MNQKSSAFGLLVAVFLAGAVTALGAVRIMDRPPPPPPQAAAGQTEAPARNSRTRTYVSDRMAKELGLTTDQRSAVSEIMARRRAATTEIMREVEPRLRSHWDSMHVEIGAVLSPEQLEEYRRMREEDRERYRSSRGRRSSRR